MVVVWQLREDRWIENKNYAHCTLKCNIYTNTSVKHFTRLDDLISREYQNTRKRGKKLKLCERTRKNTMKTNDKMPIFRIMNQWWLKSGDELLIIFGTCHCCGCMLSVLLFSTPQVQQSKIHKNHSHQRKRQHSWTWYCCQCRYRCWWYLLTKAVTFIDIYLCSIMIIIAGFWVSYFLVNWIDR